MFPVYHFVKYVLDYNTLFYFILCLCKMYIFGHLDEQGKSSFLSTHIAYINIWKIYLKKIRVIIKITSLVIINDDITNAINFTRHIVRNMRRICLNWVWSHQYSNTRNTLHNTTNMLKLWVCTPVFFSSEANRHVKSTWLLMKMSPVQHNHNSFGIITF